ncbi:MAG: hypothetical protein AAFP13_06520 [Pseudomonadota bacterium]
MSVLTKFRRIHQDECGAVTVDWVVLTAAIIGLCISIFVYFGEGMGVVGKATSGQLSEIASRIETGTVLDPY